MSARRGHGERAPHDGRRREAPAGERGPHDRRHDLAALERGLAALGDVPEQGEAEDGRAAGGAPAIRRRAARRPPPTAIVRRRLFALAAFGVIVLIGWILVNTLAGGGNPTEYEGTWFTSSNLLGSPKLVITRRAGVWAVKGLDVFGKPDKTVTLSDGKLVATGSGTSGRSRPRAAASRRQPPAHRHVDDRGTAPQIDRYTRQ